MKTFGELYQELGTVDAGDLSSNQQRMIYDCLHGNTRSSEITTVEDHIHFIEILRKLRLAGMNQMQFMGQNFMNMIQSVLSVGEDGLYSNHIRFFYELVQNVDDCDYDNVEDCKLDIEFRYEKKSRPRLSLHTTRKALLLKTYSRLQVLLRSQRMFQKIRQRLVKKESASSLCLVSLTKSVYRAACFLLTFTGTISQSQFPLMTTLNHRREPD